MVEFLSFISIFQGSGLQESKCCLLQETVKYKKRKKNQKKQADQERNLCLILEVKTAISIYINPKQAYVDYGHVRLLTQEITYQALDGNIPRILDLYQLSFQISTKFGAYYSVQFKQAQIIK